MAANQQAISAQWKVELSVGNTSLGGNHVLKAALYYQNSSIGSATSVYTTTGEVGGTNYTAGGIVVPNATGVLLSGTTSYWTPSNSLSWTNITISSPFDCVLIYDVSDANKAIGAWTFPALTITGGNFSIPMPGNTPTSALIVVN